MTTQIRNGLIVLGYWVYIPRYAYKVMRRDAVDRPVSPQNFEIRFETKTDPKKYPARTCSAGANHQNYLSCPGVNGEHGAEEGTAWATHPAFSWIYTAATNGFDKTVEMNGFWIGKYETTGIVESPTVLPNNRHIGYLSSYNIGGYYSSAKLVGQKDNYNTGGANINSKNQNYHNLASQTSHMLKNSEWGAAAYLSASGYGAGVNKVQINANDEGSDFSATGVTGCGPYDDNSRIIYRDSGELGTVSACSRSNSSRVYHGQIGILASTTNTVYGVYDMAGGAWEYTMGDYTTSQNTTSSRYFSVPANTPYVDLYRQADGFGKQKPSWSESSNSAYYNFDLCTYETCGGQALHETMTVQTITGYNNSVQWGNSAALFPDADYEWAGRGGAASQASNSGIFYSNGSSGLTGGSGSSDTAFRISIINVADATGNS